MFGPGGQRLDALEEQAYHILVEQAVAVLAEGRVVPYRLIHREADEPTKQQVEIDLLNQLPRGTDGVDHLEQRRAQQPLRCYRGPPLGGVETVEILVHRRQDSIDQLAQGTQR